MSKLRDNNDRKNTLVTRSAFKCLISRPQNLILRFRSQICGKLLPSRKLRYFIGSRFSQCFIPSTAPHNRYQVRFYANNYFELLPIVSTAFKYFSRQQFYTSCPTYAFHLPHEERRFHTHEHSFVVQKLAILKSSNEFQRFLTKTQ